MPEAPRVSIVVPYYHGIEHLPTLLRSIEEQELPLAEIECLIVQNGPDDGLRQLVAGSFPWVQVIEPDDNLGYGGGCNYGARRALGQWAAFLNTDMRVHRGWLTELLAAAERHPRAPCLGSAILSWSGRRLDFGASAMSFSGVGYQLYYGGPAKWLPSSDTRELFVCGGATFVRREVFLEVGGFDEDFWSYYEDVDLGWRLWVLGYEVWLVPSSRVFHHHHGSFSKVGRERTRLLYERNALLAVIKNYEQENLNRILPVALMLAAKRTFLATGIDPAGFRVGRTPPHARALAGKVFGLRYYLEEAMRTLRKEGIGEFGRRAIAEVARRLGSRAQAPAGAPKQTSKAAGDCMLVPNAAVSYMLALSDVADLYPAILPKRHWIQAHRQRRDADIFPLFRLALGINFLDSRYLGCFKDLVRAHDLEGLLGDKMAEDEDE